MPRNIPSRTDEFYTPLSAIEQELIYYRDFLKGKVVYCNCDDWRRSNFVKYFLDNFSSIGLKGLVSTCYNRDGNGLWMRFDGETKTDGLLNGSGDFRSGECLKILNDCDIVVTNPPFSIFMDLLQVMKSFPSRDFLVLGMISSVVSRAGISMLTSGKLFLGKSIHCGDVKFIVPDEYELRANTCGIDEEGKRFIHVTGVRWFTSVRELANDPPPLDLSAKFDSERYRSYDCSSSVLNVDKVKDIPADYYGWMGVPVTFLDKWNREQFHIADGFSYRYYLDPLHLNQYIAGDMLATSIDGKPRYARLLIRRKVTI